MQKMYLIISKNFYSNHFVGNNTYKLLEYHLAKELRMYPTNGD